MSVTEEAIELPAAPIVQAARIVDHVRVAIQVKDAAVAELKKQVRENEALANVVEQRNRELAQAGLQLVRAEDDRDAARREARELLAVNLELQRLLDAANARPARGRWRR